MVRIENLKNFQLGERVKCIDSSAPNIVYEGPITYIHPENGWLVIRVEKVKESSRAAPRRTKTRKLPVPYESSFFFYNSYRSSERVQKEPVILTGHDCIEFTRQPRTRKVYARRASSYPTEDDFGIDELLDDAC